MYAGNIDTWSDDRSPTWNAFLLLLENSKYELLPPFLVLFEHTHY